MRRFACLGLLLLAASGCATFPEHIFVDVDGSTVEIVKKKPAPPAPEPDEADGANRADAPDDARR
jgi:hypothetical protein